MLLSNFAFESAYFSLKFKEGISPQIYFPTINLPSANPSEKIFGYISKINIFYPQFSSEPQSIYFSLPEKFPVFLINMTETFKKDLNHKNVAFKFTDAVFNSLLKFQREKFCASGISYKINAIALGSAEINSSYSICGSDYMLNAVYSDNYKITFKNIAFEFMRNFFNFDIKPEISVSVEDIFKDLKDNDTQRLLNALLQKNFKLNQLAEIIYCYPELAIPLIRNLSKKNQTAAAAILLQLKENPVDENQLKNSINKNLMPVLISVIESNNFKIPNYLKIKNIYEIYEYYKIRKIFQERPFSFWFEKILKSDNKRIYEIELAKKDFLLGLTDIEVPKIKNLFSNLNETGFKNLTDDLFFLKSNTDSIKILRAKSNIVNLINEIEIPVEMLNENMIKAKELLTNTNDDLTIQYISRTIAQHDLFITLGVLKDRKIQEKFYRNFSKNMKSDFSDFVRNCKDLTNYKINYALNSIIKNYDRLSENSKIKEK